MTGRCLLCNRVFVAPACLELGLTEESRGVVEFKTLLQMIGEHIRFTHADHHVSNIAILQTVSLLLSLRFSVPEGPSAYQARARLLRECVAHVRDWIGQAEKLIDEIEPADPTKVNPRGLTN